MIVDRGQEGLRIRSGRRPWALKTHMNRLGACVCFDDTVLVDGGGYMADEVDGFVFIFLFLLL